jgi:aryl-alcohol dehydrogenase-like predicted oxidoreductase
MLGLQSLTRIGFGGYRVSRHADDHRQALRRALDAGCNLIDTAATYTNGESEELIGEVLSDETVPDSFVITKGGYVEDAILDQLDAADAEDVAAECVQTSTGSLHCIHPRFLELLLERSSHRLRRRCLDGFLLHNPEYYFDQADRPVSASEFTARLTRAFEYLEEQVHRQRIRYYGVSSNTLPLSTSHDNATGLGALLSAARRLSSTHHFAIVQFPFNLIENDAARPHHGGRSLLQVARSENVMTVANRPLNACSAAGVLRLAVDERGDEASDEERDRAVLDDCLRHLARRLEALDSPDSPMDFLPVQMISQSWKHFAGPEIVDEVFDRRLLPFVRTLYDDRLDAAVVRAFSALRAVAMSYARREANARARAFRQTMAAQGAIEPSDTRSLAVVACQYCLDSGVDNVLVGMRRPAYVDALKELWQSPPLCPAPGVPLVGCEAAS